MCARKSVHIDTDRATSDMASQQIMVAPAYITVIQPDCGCLVRHVL
jgi:hypothetical protein